MFRLTIKSCYWSIANNFLIEP
ncbi:hypothetical protein DESC_880077 [Desulfosarcina cetonica]|nr:hypothetical protein DESC_880077 [Desulfosarcina cetonica]